MKQLTLDKEKVIGELGKLKAEKMDLSEDELVEFLLHGFDIADEEMMLKGFLNQVFVFDGYMVGTLNFRNQENELEEVIVALEEAGFENKKCEPEKVRTESVWLPG